jgi:hypothetical protein
VRTLTISQPNERVLLLLLTAKKSCPLNNYALIVQEEVIKLLNVEVNWDVAIASEDITSRFVPVTHSIWAKQADIYTHESPSIAEFRL